MKLKNLVPLRYRQKVIQQFGDAKLIRTSNGQHELIGGTNADRAAAYEWASLFAHEIVFTHFQNQNHGQCRSRKILFTARLQPAL
jgi:hypothetical protein